MKKTHNQDNRIDINNSTPFRDENGKKLNDTELINLALNVETQYLEERGEAFPVDPNFMEWCHGAKAHIDNGGNITEYKKRTLVKTAPFSTYFGGQNG